MAFSDARVERLLDLIYDAATDQDLWRRVLAEITGLTGSSGSVMYGLCGRANESYLSYDIRSGLAYSKVCPDRHLEGPWTRFVSAQPVGRVVFSDEMTAPASPRRPLFFDAFLGRQDIAHDAFIVLADKDGVRAAFNVFRSAALGPFGGRDRGLLERLAPHLCRSLRLGFRIEAGRAAQDIEFEALERLSAGVILLDAQARVTYANAAALAHGGDNGPLHLCGGEIAARSPSHAPRFGELIGAALSGAPGGLMSLPRPADGGSVTVQISAVRGWGAGRFVDLGAPDAAVLIFISDPAASRAGIPLSWITGAYGLTNAEARVALAASSGLTAAEASERLRISQNTYKTHLRRVFAKTDTARQIELTRLVVSLGIASPDTPAEGEA